MTSPLHAVLVEILEAHPEALAYLLELHGSALAGPLIPTTGTRTKTVSLERRVDRAYLVGDRRAPQGFLLAEVQLDPDEDKRFSWPLYMELGRSRYRCEGALVVITVSDEVRRWIERSIAPPTGQYGTLRRLQPTVLALDAIEPSLLLSPERPYLALLAVAGHARGPNAQGGGRGGGGSDAGATTQAMALEQLDAILGMVDEALRARLENRIMEHREYRSELFRGIYKKGEAEGKAEGKAEDILTVLLARGIPVSETIRARILGCSDLDTLDAWLRRAAVASTAAAVVRSRSAPPSQMRRARKA